MWYNNLLHNSQMVVNIKDLYEDSGNRFKKINSSWAGVYLIYLVCSCSLCSYFLIFWDWRDFHFGNFGLNVTKIPIQINSLCSQSFKDYNVCVTGQNLIQVNIFQPMIPNKSSWEGCTRGLYDVTVVHFNPQKGDFSLLLIVPHSPIQCWNITEEYYAHCTNSNVFLDIGPGAGWRRKKKEAKSS